VLAGLLGLLLAVLLSPALTPLTALTVPLPVVPSVAIPTLLFWVERERDDGRESRVQTGGERQT